MLEFNFFYEHIAFIPAIAFLAAVLLKWLYIKINTWKVDVGGSLWSWWMPSAHSAVIASITTAIAIKHWIDSDLFAFATTMTVIIIYDAINVRYQAWRHGKALNKILGKEKFKESLGHLPSEAFAWSLLWIILAIIMYII